MLAQLEDQVRGGAVIEVDYLAADQRVLRVLKFGQIERKGQLALEPRLDGVPVGGDHVDGVGACECGDVEID